MNRIQKIKDVCTIIGGYAFKSNDFTSEGIPIIRIGDIYDNKVNINSGTAFLKEYNEKLNKFIIEKGDILVALSGATTGKFGIYNEDIPALLNQRVAKISPRDNIRNRYLYHYMNKLQDTIYNKASGCAQPNISPNEISEIDIYVPEISEQDKISEVLDKAQELIDKRKVQIEALDELVKSKFNEMFGNIVTNSYKWDMVKLKDICLLKSGGTPTRSKPEYFKGNIPWITTIALGKNLIDENDAVEYITQEAIKNSATKLIKEGSLLFGMRVGVGKISVNSVPMCTNQDIMAITEIDTSKYNLIFLKKIIESYSEYFNNQKRGATIQGIKSDTLKEINIPIIEIELQIKFVNFVKQVDKLKLEMEKSLKGLEDNFNSLMQRAFKGELFN